MSKGRTTFDMECPNCSETVTISYNWWSYPAYTPPGEFAPVDPPDSGVEIDTERCPYCRLEFAGDVLKKIEQAAWEDAEESSSYDY